MPRHILRRLLVSAVTLFLVTLVIYGLIRSMPGDPVDVLEPGAPLGLGREIRDQIRKGLGLDRHWLIGYLGWLGGAARGDLGRSFTDSRGVAEVIGPRIGPTLLLSGTSLALAWLLSIPLGLYAGARSGSAGERVLSTVLYMLYSLPSFVAALFLLVLLSLRLDWLPLSGLRAADEVWAGLSPAGKVLDVLRHMALPVTCLTYGSLAYYVRFVRSNLQEALRQDYVRTARAKGLGEGAVIVRHAFRNSLVPLVTLLGLTFPAILGGSVILERIFAWPGLGSLLFQKILDRDYPVVMGIALLFSVLVLVGNLLADVLYAVVDPRIRCT